jgi:homoserine dehydrogenase
VIRALLDEAGELRRAEGATLELTAIAVRDVDRATRAGWPVALLSDAPAHQVADEEIDVIVELMGGDEPAHTLIAAALSMGKHVVTANKHVIAHHGQELEAIARRTGAALRFEAAVGGGIPILGPLAGDLAANRVSRVRGIVNGTTNFILTAMTDEARPLDYRAALAEAQRLGYAEADPAGDVEGHDAANKLVILARLAFDRWLDPGAIPNRPDGADGPAGPGITTVSLADQADARRSDRIIRLLATASLDSAGRLAGAVLPTALPLGSALGRTAGVRNRIEVDATPVGRVGFDGPGAGGLATSSAVLGDLLAVARGEGSTWGPRPSPTDRAEGDISRPEAEVLEASSGVRYPLDD